ncbi:hypothetical protein RhiirA5_434798 [Rhizophagus irregularis]|uniref:Uncharacterized protein n=1 Tax=Rhizophagus irregularis TaxID=588596 RepID=A0A2N0NPG3_9GLOM|nr:hypothetical protein RhiirA5_434798 [Rhizophagus irregularis]
MAGIATKYVTENGLNNEISIKELTQHAPEFNILLMDKLTAGRKKGEAVFHNTPDTPNVLQEVKPVEGGTEKGLLRENKGIDYPDYFALESVKERLDMYDVSKVPGLQTLADIMIILCIRPAKIKTLRISNGGVTGYAKNWGQQDIP